MNIEHYQEPFPYIRIFNFYNENDLKLIWKELDVIVNNEVLVGPEHISSAYQESKEEKKYQRKGRGVWIQDIYKDLNVSYIHKLNKKLFSRQMIDSIRENGSWFYKNFGFKNYCTLLSYYENSDYYKSHVDNSYSTALTWFYKEPKQFEGGNILFSDYNIEIPIENNSILIFPSIVSHSVLEIKMEDEYMGENNGRISITNFIK